MGESAASHSQVANESYTFVQPGCLILRTESAENLTSLSSTSRSCHRGPRCWSKHDSESLGKRDFLDSCHTRLLHDTEYATHFRINRHKQMSVLWPRIVQDSLVSWSFVPKDIKYTNCLRSKVFLLILQLVVLCASLLKMLTRQAEVAFTIVELFGAGVFILLNSFHITMDFRMEKACRKTRAGRTLEYTRRLTKDGCSDDLWYPSMLQRHLYLYHIKSFVLCLVIISAIVICGILDCLSWTCLSTNICLTLEAAISGITHLQLQKMTAQIKTDQMSVLLLESILYQQELVQECVPGGCTADNAVKFYHGLQHTDVYKDMSLSYIECDPEYMYILGRREGDGQSVASVLDLTSAR